MNDDEARRVSVNYCVGDREMEGLDRMCAEADPGDWRVFGFHSRGGESFSTSLPSEGWKVVRYGGKPFERPEASFRLMARSVTAIPRLLRGIRELEKALRSAWAEVSIFKRELTGERARHENDIARAFKGETGPESDIDVLAEAIELGAFSPSPGSISTPSHRRGLLARTLRAWAAGTSLQEHPLYRVDIERLRACKAREDKIREEIDAEYAARRAEVGALLDELKLKKKEREEISSRVRAKVQKKPSGE